MISIIVTSVKHFDDHIIPLYKSFSENGHFEFILMMSNPIAVLSRSSITNKALKVASGDWLVVLDNDVRCTGELGFIEHLDPSFIYGTECQQNNPKWLNEPCMIFHRTLYEKIGGFDEKFLTSMACGGADYCIRANLAGFETKIISAPIVHLAAGTKNDNPGHEDTRQANHRYFREKWSL